MYLKEYLNKIIDLIEELADRMYDRDVICKEACKDIEERCHELILTCLEMEEGE